MGERKLETLKQLIVVDDEGDMLDLYRHFFRKESAAGDFDLRCFTSAISCLEFLKQNDCGPSDTLVISDINMPEMSGFELIEKIKLLHPQLSVWIASAYSNEEYRNQALNSGAEGYFEKPIDFRVLKAAIKSKVS